MAKLQTLAAALLAVSPLLGSAHPGETRQTKEAKAGIAARHQAAALSARAAQACASNPKSRDLQDKAAVRRSLSAQLLRQERDIVHKPLVSRKNQDALDDWFNTCHDQGEFLDYDLSTPERTVFASNTTTALAPEVGIGQQFVAGEFLRGEIAEGQPGIPIHVDLQFVDADTCEPVPNLLVDLWQANATGAYSGLGGDHFRSTFLRGVQVSDYEGIVEFDSIYPGHAAGRTNHLSIAARHGAKVLQNGTYTGGRVNHIGELYFDEELNAVIENLEPYLRNREPRTPNAADAVLGSEASSGRYDPFVNYVRLSDVASDGLLLWITVGVNTTADYSDKAVAAATHTKGGGWAGNQTATSPSRPKKSAVQAWGPCI